MKVSNPNSLKALHCAVFMAATLSAAPICAFAYVSTDKVSEINTTGYFNNSDKYLPDLGVLYITSIDADGEIEHYPATFKKVAKKPTKTKPAKFEYQITPIAVTPGEAPDLTAFEDRLKVLEEVKPVDTAALEQRLSDAEGAISKLTESLGGTD